MSFFQLCLSSALASSGGPQGKQRHAPSSIHSSIRHLRNMGRQAAATSLCRSPRNASDETAPARTAGRAAAARGGSCQSPGIIVYLAVPACPRALDGAAVMPSPLPSPTYHGPCFLLLTDMYQIPHCEGPRARLHLPSSPFASPRTPLPEGPQLLQPLRLYSSE